MTNQNEGWELRIKEIDLFEDIAHEVMEKIADICNEEKYSKGTTIFREGEEATDLFILEEGNIELQIKGEMPVYELKEEGSVFGWSSLVETAEYTASAVCQTDICAIRIDSRRLNKVFSGNPDMGFVFYKKLSGVFNQRLTSIYQKFLSVR